MTATSCSTVRRRASTAATPCSTVRSRTSTAATSCSTVRSRESSPLISSLNSERTVLISPRRLEVDENTIAPMPTPTASTVLTMAIVWPSSHVGCAKPSRCFTCYPTLFGSAFVYQHSRSLGHCEGNSAELFLINQHVSTLLYDHTRRPVMVIEGSPERPGSTRRAREAGNFPGSSMPGHGHFG